MGSLFALLAIIFISLLVVRIGTHTLVMTVMVCGSEEAVDKMAHPEQ